MGGENVNRDCALRLAAAGLAVFPVRPTDRRPVFQGWTKRSTSDAEIVGRWWTLYPHAVPALNLAAAGLATLDGDRHHPQVDGVAALRALLQQQPGFDSRGVPMTRTPRDGVHVFFRQGTPALTNRRGQLPAGVDVRGAGGFVIAPGADLGKGRSYRPIEGQPDLATAFRAGSILPVPAGIVALIGAARPRQAGAHRTTPPTPREHAYAVATLRRLAGELAAATPGTRNDGLNKAAFVLGTMVARDWIQRDTVEDALTAAMGANAYTSEKGAAAVAATLTSGLNAGLQSPCEDLPEQGIALDDFVSHAPSRMYFFLPCREPWPGASVNSRLPKIEVTTADGEVKEVAPAAWLDRHRSVEQMTWAPGEPTLIADKLFLAAGGWVKRRGVASLNHYRPPLIEPGNAAEADMWVDHVQKIYPDDAKHIIRWLAHRVQRPAEKINHALLLGGLQGIGKDSLLQPVKYAVGPWNVAEVSPVALLGRFNGFLKSVILRVSEMHDLGEFDRFALYERLKALTASPPDALRVDEKFLREYAIVNCTGLVLTTNHRTNGIYLPADDRRHYVCWSDCRKEDFVSDYWRRLWGWYDAGGLRHVTAYLSELDLSGFDPAAPPLKTPAFWDIADAGRATEDAEIADVLDALKRPDAVTLAQVREKADVSLTEWLSDRRNRRAIPHRLEACGYTPVRNPVAASDGLWKIKDMRQAVYAKAELPAGVRLRAAQRLTGVTPWMR